MRGDTFEFRYTYDEKDRLLTAQRWVKNELRWQDRYDYASDTVKQQYYTSRIEAEYLCRTIVYDSHGREIRDTSFASPSERGKFANLPWFSEMSTEYRTYHSNGRLKSYDARGASLSVPTDYFTFEYDSLGRISGITGEMEFKVTHADADSWPDVITLMGDHILEYRFIREFDTHGNPAITYIIEAEKNALSGSAVPFLYRKVEVETAYW